ncbi:hypothetical protein ACFJGW_06755 [Burkholderiaceae bacterium UC74_6]
MLDAAYQKTEAGRAEIKARALPLSRSARNLLLMLDGTRSARVWLEMVRGTTEADLDFLLQHGLIAASVAAAPKAAPASAPSSPAAVPVPVPAPASALTSAPASAAASGSVFAPTPVASGEPMGFDELYSWLTENARQHLGLIKGYRMVLDVERCTELAELRELAWKIVAEVDRTDGEAAADRVRLEMRL